MHVTPELREFLFRYDRHAPLAVETVKSEAGQNLVRERLIFASVNQARVPAILSFDPNTPAPRPALMIQHGLHSSKDDPRLAELTAAWTPFGFAVLTIDAPLHGERSEGELDLMSLLGQPYTGLRFVVQNVVDLRRAVDLLHERPDIAGHRIAYVGLSMSTFLGVQFVA